MEKLGPSDETSKSVYVVSGSARSYTLASVDSHYTVLCKDYRHAGVNID